MIALVLAAILLALGTRIAHAHGMRSAYLELTQTAPGRARLALRGKVPLTGVELRAAPPCAVEHSADTGSWLSCPGTLAGARLTVEGLGPIVSEAVIYASFLDGGRQSAVATAAAPRWTVPGGGAAGSLEVAGRYVVLGVEHIATGADHLLFLLALVLCLRRLRAVMIAESAFTLSHTLSFSASSLGWVHVSSSAAEACIAASLILVALDVGRPGQDAAGKSAALAFVFGVVHGLGFAGGLAELGLPDDAVPAALAGFAAGVELGQVAFLLVACGALALLRRVPRFGLQLGTAAAGAGALAIGSVGWCWFVERLAALV